jgi:dihydroneopterin aldolase
MADHIFIEQLRLRTHIGVAVWEQKARQDVLIDIVIHHDQSAAAASDDVADTIDYRGIRDELVKYAESSNHALLESFAQTVADIVLTRDGVIAVDVKVAKPGALRFAESVAVAIHRP